VSAVKTIPHAARTQVLTTILDQLHVSDDPIAYEPFMMMDWDDARALGESGLVTFGGHTVNHEIVSRLNDADVRREIVESIESVGAHVSGISKTFAYPNGSLDDFDERAVRAVRSSSPRRCRRARRRP